MVVRYKRHIFTFVFEMRLIAQKQLKPYQSAYYASLKRDWFCVLDKVMVTGVPFAQNICDLVMFCTGVSMLLNFFDLCGVQWF